MALLQITEPGSPREPHSRKLSIGIDLGTTNSIVAGVREGKAFALPDLNGNCLVPSVVNYSETSVLVGQPALEKSAHDSLNTITSVKRLMGRALTDLVIREGKLPYEFLNESKTVPRIKTAKGLVTPTQVSSEIIKTLLERATATFENEVDGAVITVPAHFDDSQRQATKDAAKLAGLNVMRLINEPTAAALAYGLDSGQEGSVVIYDLGGGTFDVSLLRMENGLFRVLATGGDVSLGGDDFDSAICQWIIDSFEIEDTISSDERRAVLLEARNAKEKLVDSEFEELRFHLQGVDRQIRLTRGILEGLCAPLVEKTLDICKQVVNDAKIQMKDIDNVVLVGGSTRSLMVRKAAESFFGKKPLFDIDPEKVVAIGAAIQADLLIGNNPDSEVLLLDVLPLSLGLEMMGGLSETILLRNTPIPANQTREFTTQKDGQTSMKIHVVQGERDMASDCRSLAEFDLKGIPPLVAGAARIQVIFQVDADGLLSVSASEVTSSVKASIEVKPTYGLTEQEITQMLASSFEMAEKDAGARMLAEARVEAARVVEALETALEKDGYILNDEVAESLKLGLEKLRAISRDQDYREINAGIDLLGKASEEFAALRMDMAINKALAGQKITEIEREL